MHTQVLIDRLVESLDPFWLLGWKGPHPSLIEVLAYPSAPFIEKDIRGFKFDEYDWGRIAYFVREVQAGRTIEPIQIDCFCDAGNIYSEAVMLDGCHRLAAYLLVKSPTIEVQFGGRMDYLEWLEGKTDMKPEW